METKGTSFSGDARDVLKSLPQSSVDCIVCSPPYFGLRKYLCEPSIWLDKLATSGGGDENCKHEWVTATRKLHSGTNALQVAVQKELK